MSKKPEFGMLRGKKVKLSEIEKIPAKDRPLVIVTMPDGSKMRPWRFIGDEDDVGGSLG